MSEEKNEARPLVTDFLEEFKNALFHQLIADDSKWGETWLNRPREGQELRTEAQYEDYFDQFRYARVPVPWLKIIGGALICWIRENHPEVCPDADVEVDEGSKDIPKSNCEHLPEITFSSCPECVGLKEKEVAETEKPVEDMTVKELVESPSSECSCLDCNLPDLGKLDPAPPDNEFLKEGDTESRVPNSEGEEEK